MAGIWHQAGCCCEEEVEPCSDCGVTQPAAEATASTTCNGVSATGSYSWVIFLPTYTNNCCQWRWKLTIDADWDCDLYVSYNHASATHSASAILSFRGTPIAWYGSNDGEAQCYVPCDEVIGTISCDPVTGYLNGTFTLHTGCEYGACPGTLTITLNP